MSRSPEAVLVTGASGFIGTRLVARLNREGYRVVAVDLSPPRETLAGVAYHSLDVRESLPPSLGSGVGRIYNLAAIHRTPGHDTHEYYDTNIRGALNVTSLARSCSIPILVFTSSISVYGPSERRIDERSPLQPVSAYGHSKKISEEVHRAWRSGSTDNRLVIVRPGVVFGPGELGNYTNLARALSRGLFFYPGRSGTIKSGGYVDDLIASFEFAVEKGDPEITYNFANPTLSSTKDIVSAFAEICGFKKTYATLPVAPLYLAAGLFEIASTLGLKNPIHRERVMKLVRSTSIEPGWLVANGFQFGYDLHSALRAWREESGGAFV